MVLLAGSGLGLLAGLLVDRRFAGLVVLCVVSGFLSALCFWLIVREDRRTST